MFSFYLDEILTKLQFLVVAKIDFLIAQILPIQCLLILIFIGFRTMYNQSLLILLFFISLYIGIIDYLILFLIILTVICIGIIDYLILFLILLIMVDIGATDAWPST